MHQPDDAELVAAACQGDWQAFGVLATRHQALVSGLCARVMADFELGRDAAQEALVVAFLSLDGLRQPERFGSWLAGIGLNICRRWLRERARDLWSWEALQGGRQLEDPTDPGPYPEELAEANDLAERVRSAVDVLPSGQRAAVLLVYLRGLNYVETATLLGIEVSAVKTRLHKARLNLRGELQALWEEETMAEEPVVQAKEVRVTDVRRMPAEDDRPGLQGVVLEETEGERWFAVWMGPFEVVSIAMLLQGVETARPMTYAFAAGVLQAAGGQLQEVRIAKLVGDTFYAVATVKTGRRVRHVDARPSDAIALALSMGAPIKVEEQVFSVVTAGMGDRQAAPKTVEPPWQGAAEIVADMMEGRGPYAPAPLRQARTET